jgi:PIN domain nuclease of toxin-antitoxin system
VIVLDTHVLVWWVNGSPALSARAQREIRSVLKDAPLNVSAISIFEIRTAARRGRLELSTPVDQWIGDLANLHEVHIQPVTREIAALAGSFDDTIPGDPADRIIAATTLVLDAKLLTADDRLRRLPHLQSIW